MRWSSPGLLAVAAAAFAIALGGHTSAAAPHDKAAPVVNRARATSSAADRTIPRPSARQLAGGPAHGSRATAASRDARPVSASGMVIGIDPETGKIGMPTGEQMRRIAAQNGARASSRPVPVTHPDGSVSLDTRGWMQEHFVVLRGPDGRLVPMCVDGPEQAARAMKQAPRVAAGLEEK